MLLNHPTPGEDGFTLGTITSLRQVPLGRGEALGGGLGKVSPFGEAKSRESVAWHVPGQGRDPRKSLPSQAASSHTS